MDNSQIEENTEEQPPGIMGRQVSKTYPNPTINAELSEIISTEIVTDIKQCELLWHKWSKKQSLFDTWEFRYSFYQGYHHQPHFIIVKSDQKVIGMLPLWYEKDNDKYAWFGSWWQEDNSIFAIAPKYIPDILSVCPEKSELNAVIPESISTLDRVLFEEDIPKYILSLETISSSNDFVQNLKKKKRYNIKRDCRVIQEQNPEIIVNHFEDFSELVRLSTERFEQKGDEADWIDPRRVETFRQVIAQGRLNTSYEIRMVTVKIGGKTASVDLIAIYNHTYYAIKCGYDVSSFPGIGNYVNVFEIEDAIKLKCQKMDFLEIGYGWKDGWFTSVPLLKFKK